MYLLPRLITNPIWNHIVIVTLTLLTVDIIWCSSCLRSHSPSHLHSCSCSCDCHDNNHHKNHSLSNHHSHYAGHHDFPPPVKHRVVDIGNSKPVGYADIAFEVLSHSEGHDNTAYHTNPDENPYHPTILMATAITKIPRQHLIAQLLMQTMNLIKHLTLVKSPQQTYLQHLTYATLTTLNQDPSWVSLLSCCLISTNGTYIPWLQKQSIPTWSCW